MSRSHISKPFKSDDIVQMVTQVMEGTTAAEIGIESALQERVVEDDAGLRSLSIDEEVACTQRINVRIHLCTDIHN